MPPDYFPLRWESTGEQWWYASPIDWAAANGLYDVVRELLHLDPNLLIKLTSLRRIRRLETVWDDDTAVGDVARCRATVARRLLLDCEPRKGKGENSLVRAGYGGWLVYTAASAGDLEFVKELLERDPFLVFGEGEYGVSDVLYAAARSKNVGVFRFLLESAVSQGNGLSGGEGDGDRGFRWEIMNRAVHAAARGGNVEILRELIDGCSDVSAYRDLQGSTVLHSASGRGQVEVVKDLIASYDIINSTDNHGNTALHVAAYRGHLSVVEVLILASPSLASVMNSYGDTFLHLAVAGFRTPGFRRVDHQIKLMKQLLCGKIINIEDIINVRNNDGRTALHMAVTENIQTSLVELLVTVRSINLNVRDSNGMTPLDLLKQRPMSTSSNILIKQLISAGGITNCRDRKVRNVLASHLREQGVVHSPGTSFRIPDGEILLYAGVDSACGSHFNSGLLEYASCVSEISDIHSGNLSENKMGNSLNRSGRRLKFLFGWAGRKERNAIKVELRNDNDDDSFESVKVSGSFKDHPISLRQRYSKQASLPNNKRTYSLGADFPSPSTRKKYTTGLMHGVLQARPQFWQADSGPSSYAGSSVSSPMSVDARQNINVLRASGSIKPSNDGSAPGRDQNKTSLNRRLMNQYFCFGAQRLATEDSIESAPEYQAYEQALMV
ncbi:ankyrin repeat and sterile alpha motif domain-containing protein 1B-like [Rhodamnia argentea]|uniref:Ankyrin repeat and sterile alpha motif domain-containing protein 1B-like n=1 Tax=Rhodamnia argentea TaxID=178133 RepID=A0A8B8P153_9MYRT|nr:ankyrin repeat and sterile alpha motif domain-containing protein 1B-like [Rhodamnia argentea]